MVRTMTIGLDIKLLAAVDRGVLACWWNWATQPQFPGSVMDKARLYSTAGYLYSQLGMWSLAVQNYMEAAQTYLEAGCPGQQAESYICISHCFLRLACPGAALRFARYAVQAVRQGMICGSDRPLLYTYANARQVLGLAYLYQGRLGLGTRLLKRALVLYNGFDCRRGQQTTLAALGTAYAEQGQLCYALGCYKAALDLPPTAAADLAQQWYGLRVRYLMAVLYHQCGYPCLMTLQLQEILTTAKLIDPSWIGYLRKEIIALSSLPQGAVQPLQRYRVAFG